VEYVGSRPTYETAAVCHIEDTHCVGVAETCTCTITHSHLLSLYICSDVNFYLSTTFPSSSNGSKQWCKITDKGNCPVSTLCTQMYQWRVFYGLVQSCQTSCRQRWVNNWHRRRDDGLCLKWQVSTPVNDRSLQPATAPNCLTTALF